MNKIICPHCNKEFELTDAEYLSIIEQVKNDEFDKRIHEKEQQILKEKASEIALLKSQHKNEVEKAVSEKEKEVTALSEQLIMKEVEKELAVATAVTDRDKTISKLQNTIENVQQTYKLKENTLKASY